MRKVSSLRCGDGSRRHGGNGLRYHAALWVCATNVARLGLSYPTADSNGDLPKCACIWLFKDKGSYIMFHGQWCPSLVGMGSVDANAKTAAESVLSAYQLAGPAAGPAGPLAKEALNSPAYICPAESSPARGIRPTDSESHQKPSAGGTRVQLLTKVSHGCMTPRCCHAVLEHTHRMGPSEDGSSLANLPRPRSAMNRYRLPRSGRRSWGSKTSS